MKARDVMTKSIVKIGRESGFEQARSVMASPRDSSSPGLRRGETRRRAFSEGSRSGTRPRQKTRRSAT